MLNVYCITTSKWIKYTTNDIFAKIDVNLLSRIGDKIDL
jgi:hypothetical protein